MIEVQLSQLAEVLGAELVGGDTAIANVSTDTRKIATKTLATNRAYRYAELCFLPGVCKKQHDDKAKVLLRRDRNDPQSGAREP